MGIALPLLHFGQDEAPPPPAPLGRSSTRGRSRGLVDSHGRRIRTLRLSITDRCNFRCVYCMDPSQRFMDRGELLSATELLRAAAACIRLGVDTVRLTGGEPTLRSDLMEIVKGIRALSADVSIAMTTNGSLCDPSRLAELREAGLNRLTFSLDALDDALFRRLTRSRLGVADVLHAIRASHRAGFTPIKINAVIMRGLNDDQVVPLASLARDLDAEMRFIEFMPLDSSRAWRRSEVVSANEIHATINETFPLRRIGFERPSDTAEVYEFADGAPGRIGLIAPVSRPFCGACSRLRITADGQVRPCLFSTREWNLRPILRDGSDADIDAFLIDATWTKQASHGIGDVHFEQPQRGMSAIGG